MLQAEQIVLYRGQEAVLLQRSHGYCRFIQALGRAVMLKRLKSESGSGFLIPVDYTKLEGLKRDKHDRAAQLNDLEGLGLIMSMYGGPKGLWEYQWISLTPKGLELIGILRENHERIGIAASAYGSCFAAPIDVFG